MNDPIDFSGGDRLFYVFGRSELECLLTTLLISLPSQDDERHGKVIADQVPNDSTSFESRRSLVDNGKIKLFSFNTTHCRFDRHAFVDFKTSRFEWFGVPRKGFNVWIENQYLPRIVERADYH